tara:strand:+ start:2532 stop:6170 length:3639 start_codon:yes stop_codon:yes gene_type:complete
MASSGHAAVLHPKIESTVSPDAGLVSITKHGIAACREITLKGNSTSPSQMSFSRVMNPTDLLDKTIVLEMPIESVYTITDPCGSPATVTMLAERLGVGSQHMTLRSNGVNEAITHCNLTLNNGTLTTQPNISSQARSFYTSHDQADGNNGLGMRDASTSPFISNLSGQITHDNGVLDTMLPVHMHKRLVTDLVLKGTPSGLDGSGKAKSAATVKTNLLNYFNSGDAARGKTYAHGDINYWPNNLVGASHTTDGLVTSGGVPYIWDDACKIQSVTVIDTVYATVPHDLLDDENEDECLSNIRFFDLKINMPDPSVMFNMSRDFTIPWQPFIDPTASVIRLPGTDTSTAVAQIGAIASTAIPSSAMYKDIPAGAEVANTGAFFHPFAGYLLNDTAVEGAAVGWSADGKSIIARNTISPRPTGVGGFTGNFLSADAKGVVDPIPQSAASLFTELIPIDESQLTAIGTEKPWPAGWSLTSLGANAIGDADFGATWQRKQMFDKGGTAGLVEDLTYADLAVWVIADGANAKFKSTAQGTSVGKIAASPYGNVANIRPVHPSNVVFTATGISVKAEAKLHYEGTTTYAATPQYIVPAGTPVAAAAYVGASHFFIGNALAIDHGKSGAVGPGTQTAAKISDTTTYVAQASGAEVTTSLMMVKTPVEHFGTGTGKSTLIHTSKTSLLPIHSQGGQTLDGDLSISNTTASAIGRARPFTITSGGYNCAAGETVGVVTGGLTTGLGVVPVSIPTLRPAAEFGTDLVTSSDNSTWDKYYAAHDPRAMISGVTHTFNEQAYGRGGPPRLHMRLYQSAVPVPRALSFGISTDIIRSLKTDVSVGSLDANGIYKASPKSINTDSFSLSEVPQAIYVYAVLEDLDTMGAGEKMSMPPQLANISQINFRTTANTGTLSTATPRQLFQMCQRNGCNQDFTSFINDGNVIKINPSKDLGGWVEGARETFTHDFEVTVTPPCMDPTLNARQCSLPNEYFQQTSSVAIDEDVNESGVDLWSTVVGAGNVSLSHLPPSACINYTPPVTLRNGYAGVEPDDYALYGSKDFYPMTPGKDKKPIWKRNMASTAYNQLVTTPQAMRTFSTTTFQRGNVSRKVTVYTVYEMVGTCHLQADGLMQTTSGFDTSTIVDTLQSSGLAHSSQLDAEMGGGWRGFIRGATKAYHTVKTHADTAKHIYHRAQNLAKTPMGQAVTGAVSNQMSGNLKRGFDAILP